MTSNMSPGGIDRDILRHECGVEPRPLVQPYRLMSDTPKGHVLGVSCVVDDSIFREFVYFGVSGRT